MSPRLTGWVPLAKSWTSHIFRSTTVCIILVWSVTQLYQAHLMCTIIYSRSVTKRNFNVNMYHIYIYLSIYIYIDMHFSIMRCLLLLSDFQISGQTFVPFHWFQNERGRDGDVFMHLFQGQLLSYLSFFSFFLLLLIFCCYYYYYYTNTTGSDLRYTHSWHMHISQAYLESILQCLNVPLSFLNLFFILLSFLICCNNFLFYDWHVCIMCEWFVSGNSCIAVFV